MSDRMSTSRGVSTTGTDPTETLERLLDSARTIAARDGCDNLTIHAVAAAAGVASTEAHAYFGSDAQVIAEVLWRQLISSPRTASCGAGSRMIVELRSEAVDTLRLRARTAGRVQRRIRAALGRRADATTVERLEAIYTAGLYDAGTGYAILSRRLRSPEKLVNRILDRR